jgi:hypothetical protein
MKFDEVLYIVYMSYMIYMVLVQNFNWLQDMGSTRSISYTYGSHFQLLILFAPEPT